MRGCGFAWVISRQKTFSNFAEYRESFFRVCASVDIQATPHFAWRATPFRETFFRRETLLHPSRVVCPCAKLCVGVARAMCTPGARAKFLATPLKHVQCSSSVICVTDMNIVLPNLFPANWKRVCRCYYKCLHGFHCPGQQVHWCKLRTHTENLSLHALHSHMQQGCQVL